MARISWRTRRALVAPRDSHAYGRDKTPQSESIRVGLLVALNFLVTYLYNTHICNRCILLKIIGPATIWGLALKMPEKLDFESTNRLLRVMIALLVRQKEESPTPLRQQIETLHSLGLRPAEIAEILGRSGTYINKELSGLRKTRKRQD